MRYGFTLVLLSFVVLTLTGCGSAMTMMTSGVTLPQETQQAQQHLDAYQHVGSRDEVAARVKRLLESRGYTVTVDVRDEVAWITTDVKGGHLSLVHSTRNKLPYAERIVHDARVEEVSPGGCEVRIFYEVRGWRHRDVLAELVLVRESDPQLAEEITPAYYKLQQAACAAMLGDDAVCQDIDQDRHIPTYAPVVAPAKR